LQAARNGALHNQEWPKIEVTDFKAMRAEGLDPARFSAGDEQAAKIVESGGYSQPKIRQVLNSGKDFTPRPFAKGETLYAFDSADYVGKDADSPFCWTGRRSMTCGRNSSATAFGTGKGSRTEWLGPLRNSSHQDEPAPTDGGPSWSAQGLAARATPGMSRAISRNGPD
jgi:hypothetical protein